jgi:predicted extracellular nuclease
MKTLKRSIIMILSVILLSGSVMAPATTTTVEASSKPKLNKTSMVMTVGETAKLKLKNSTEDDVKWSSTKKSIATVSKTGKVKAKKEGNTTIVATYKDKKYKCKVTVNAAEEATEKAETVWISATGKKYHTKVDCGNINENNASLVTKDYAVNNLNLEPCKKCYGDVPSDK